MIKLCILNVRFLKNSLYIRECDWHLEESLAKKGPYNMRELTFLR